MPRTLKTVAVLIAASIALAAPRAALACSACVGRSDDASVQGLNAAVVTLMAALLLVLSAAAGFLVYLIRQSAKHPLALPGMPGGDVQ